MCLRAAKAVPVSVVEKSLEKKGSSAVLESRRKPLPAESLEASKTKVRVRQRSKGFPGGV
jgi:hypothetical protein